MFLIAELSGQSWHGMGDYLQMWSYRNRCYYIYGRRCWQEADHPETFQERQWRVGLESYDASVRFELNLDGAEDKMPAVLHQSA